MAFDNLDKLLLWEKKEQGAFDYILGSGDFGNINHTVDKKDLECQSVLSMIEKRYASLTEEKKAEEEAAERDIALVI